MYVKIIVKGIWWDFLAGFYVWMSAGVSLYVWLYGTIGGNERHEVGFLDDVFVICVNTWVIFDHLVIFVHTNKRYYYRETRVICDNLNVHFHTNIRYEECAVCLDMIYAGVCFTIACIGYFCHYNITFLFFLKIDVKESMELIQENKFIVFWPGWG